MLPALSQFLLAHWSDLQVERPRPGRLHFLGARTRVGAGYALFFAFADIDSRPCLMVKIAREPTAEARLTCEWQTLTYFQNNSAKWFSAHLPRPLVWEFVNGVQVLVTTAPQGHPIRPSKSAAKRHFAQVGDWLVQLGSATRTTTPAGDVCREMERGVERLYATFDLSNQERTTVQEWLSQWGDSATDGQIPVFAAHGNLQAGNIWMANNTLSVINWEWSELHTLPFQDLFRFITTYQMPTSRRQPIEEYLHAFRATYLTDSSYSNRVCQSIGGYCRALDIPPTDIEAQFGLFLIHAALREHGQLLVAAERGYLPLPQQVQRPHREAIKEQIWISLLRLLIKERRYFAPRMQLTQYRPIHFAKNVHAGVALKHT